MIDLLIISCIAYGWDAGNMPFSKKVRNLGPVEEVVKSVARGKGHRYPESSATRLQTYVYMYMYTHIYANIHLS